MGTASRAAACVLLLGLLASAQAPPSGSGGRAQADLPEVAIQTVPFRPQPILTTSTQVVPLAAVVRDSHGRIIDNLTRDDFEVLDRGTPQTLASFSIERHAVGGAATAPVEPRTVAFFFDDLNSSSAFGNIQHARQVALDFLRVGLPPGEQAGVFTASGEHQVPFTTDTAALEQAVAALQPVDRINRPCGVFAGSYNGWNHREIPYAYAAYQAVVLNRTIWQEVFGHCFGQEDGTPPLPPEVAMQMGLQNAQRYWDQLEAQSRGIFASLDRAITRLGAQPGDRVLVVTGSGFITDTLRQDQARVEEDATRFSVTVNVLDTDGVPDSIPQWLTQAGQGAAQDERSEITVLMTDMVGVTGGTFYRDPRDLGPGMQALANGPAAVYRMSFVPTPLVADGSFHPIKVRLRSRHAATIETRAGYYAPARIENPSSADLTQRLNAAAMADVESAEIPATLTLTAVPQSGSGPAQLKLAIIVNAAKLSWADIAGRSSQVLTFAAVLSRPDGAYVTGEKSEMTLLLRDATRKKLKQTGVTGEMHIPAAAGAYRLRVVVMESVQGHISSFTRQVTVP